MFFDEKNVLHTKEVIPMIKINERRRDLFTMKLILGGTVLASCILLSKTQSNHSLEGQELVIIAREDTAMEELSSNLSYDLETLKALNKDLSKSVEKGVEVVLKKPALNTDDYRTYIIKKGDTIESIAARFGLSEETIAQEEKLASDDSIRQNYHERISLYCQNEHYDKDNNKGKVLKRTPLKGK